MGTYSQAEFDGVHRMVEGPGKLMLPQSLHHYVLHVLQLVGFPAGATGGKKHTHLAVVQNIQRETCSVTQVSH